MPRWRTDDEHKKALRKFVRSKVEGIEITGDRYSQIGFERAIREVQSKKKKKVYCILRQGRLYLINRDVIT